MDNLYWYVTVSPKLLLQKTKQRISLNFVGNRITKAHITVEYQLLLASLMVNTLEVYSMKAVR
jgi:hypothetical protein